MRICICGGGNLGHVCAGFLANRGHEVSILTTKPERWTSEIEIIAPDVVAFIGQNLFNMNLHGKYLGAINDGENSFFII